MADILKKDLQFSSTPLGKFESIVLDPVQAFLKEKEVDNPILYPDMDDNTKLAYSTKLNTLEFSSAFIAHVSPSFEGKTQSAFVLSKVRPLYFAIDQVGKGTITTTQSVYLNFESLNSAIENYAEADLVTLKVPRNLESIEKISETKLSLDHSYTPFKVLGFLAFLIDDAEANFNSDSKRAWMDFYANREEANRPAKILFYEMTIAQFKLKLLKSSKYCLFLDEFGKSAWMVLLRNLARSVGLRCIVANTNTNIANITGRKGGSRGDGFTAWSILLNKLNPVNLEVAKNLIDWTKMKRIVLEKFRAPQNRLAFEGFIDDIFTEQIAHIRPGIMIKLTDCLNNAKDRGELKSFSSFFNSVMVELFNEIISRKSKMISTEQGCIGTIGLMTNIPYVTSSVDNCENLFKRKMYLEDHLYYLINPADNRKSNLIALFSQTEGGGGCLDYLARDGSIQKWTLEKTYFKAEDIFTILACLCITFENTISAMMAIANEKHHSSGNSTSAAKNPTAQSLDPDSLEAAAAISVIYSSHIKSRFGADLIFDGRSGTVFMYNLVQNLISNIDHKIQTGIILNYKSTSTKRFINNIQIPFLLPYNFPSESIPSILKNLHDRNIINIGTFTRTPNGDMIDGKFDFKHENVPCTAAVE